MMQTKVQETRTPEKSDEDDDVNPTKSLSGTRKRTQRVFSDSSNEPSPTKATHEDDALFTTGDDAPSPVKKKAATFATDENVTAEKTKKRTRKQQAAPEQASLRRSPRKHVGTTPPAKKNSPLKRAQTPPSHKKEVVHDRERYIDEDGFTVSKPKTHVVVSKAPQQAEKVKDSAAKQAPTKAPAKKQPKNQKTLAAFFKK